MALVTQSECPSCGRKYGERHRIIIPQPSIEQLEAWTLGDGDCEATDGCIVEPDGICEHGHTSWLRQLGMI